MIDRCFQCKRTVRASKLLKSTVNPVTPPDGRRTVLELHSVSVLMRWPLPGWPSMKRASRRVRPSEPSAGDRASTAHRCARSCLISTQDGADGAKLVKPLCAGGRSSRVGAANHGETPDTVASPLAIVSISNGRARSDASGGRRADEGSRFMRERPAIAASGPTAPEQRIHVLAEAASTCRRPARPDCSQRTVSHALTRQGMRLRSRGSASS